MLPRQTKLKTKRSFKNNSPINGGSPRANNPQSKYNTYLSTESGVVEEQYAIKKYSQHSIVPLRINQNKRDREICHKYSAKIQADAEQHSQQLAKKRSISSSKRALNTSRSISSDGKNLRQRTVQTRKKSLNRNSLNVVMGPQRYIRLNGEQVNSQKQKQNKKRILSLQKELMEYKNKYQSSLKAINKMNKFIVSEKSRFILEKQVYEEKLRILKAQLESKNKVNQEYSKIPHLFMYQDQNAILPESMILENVQENQNSSFYISKDHRDNKSPKTQMQQIQHLMQEYLAKFESKNSSELKSNLSIESK